MMINLGLARITRLLESTPLPWKAIHVAGTNGKGSVCAYASAMLQSANVRAGRFTSPHLIDRWDCITIDEKIIDENRFRMIEKEIKHIDTIKNVQASEFELLTATAFTIFTREKVDLAVVEVGMGGKEDATNIIQDPLATIITNISEDHQAFLGNTIQAIAAQKAGIMKPCAPCYVDGTNATEVLSVIQENADRTQSGTVVRIPQDREEQERQVWTQLSIKDFEPHQRIHVSLAFAAVERALCKTHTDKEILQLLSAVPKTVWPGRLQAVNIGQLTGRQAYVLLDGAHNSSSAQVLGLYVDGKVRQEGKPITWVIASSRGKNLPAILSHFIKPEDCVIATQFGPVDGMPWVQPADTAAILTAANGLGVPDRHLGKSTSVSEALSIAADVSQGKPMVIAGSLYLVSDILRLLRDDDTQG